MIIECTGKCKRDCSCLACNTAAANRYFKVVLTFKFRYFEWHFGYINTRLGTQVLINGLAINNKFTCSRLYVQAGCGSFSSSYIVFFWHMNSVNRSLFFREFERSGYEPVRQKSGYFSSAFCPVYFWGACLLRHIRPVMSDPSPSSRQRLRRFRR